MVSVFMLAGCGAPSRTADNSSYADKIAKKPGIPVTDDLGASILDADKKNSGTDNTDKLIEKIDNMLKPRNITEEDIRRGWYYGSRDDIRYGTPPSWIWISDSADGPKWASPDAFKETDYFNAKELCEQTAGSYVISCLDTDISECEYVPKSQCYCLDGSKWDDGQGCVLTDEKGGFVSITRDDLSKGWYYGLPSQKKLDTPPGWVWAESGRSSKWQNPSPN
jgi:hypothetical protein